MTETTSLPLGTVWEIPTKVAVTVTRPDGRDVSVLSNGKVAGYVLDVPGEYTAQLDKPVTVKAG